MKKTRLLTSISAAFLVALTALVATVARSQPTSAAGLEPYTPTRIEWLCVEYNSFSATALTHESKHWKHATYRRRTPNAVVISVGYLPTMDRELLNQLVNHAREELQAMAKSHGWDWLTIVEDVRMVDVD